MDKHSAVVFIVTDIIYLHLRLHTLLNVREGEVLEAMSWPAPLTPRTYEGPEITVMYPGTPQFT